MTTNESTTLVSADLDTLRQIAHNLTVQYTQEDNSAWIGHASRKQLLAEIIRLYANNYHGAAKK